MDTLLLHTSCRLIVVSDTNDRWRASRETDRGSPDTLSQLTAAWFWTTLLGTFYIGVVHVLPDLYGSDTRLLTAQRALAVFMLVEILINWLCVRYVSSYYRPDMKPTDASTCCKTEMDPRCSGAESNGFIIDLAMLRTKGEDTNGNGACSSVYSLPISSVRDINESSSPPNDGQHDKRWRRGDTIYVVATSGRDDCDGRPATLEKDMRRGGTRRLVYPYWSWKPCPVCRHRRPPRAHHCRRCGACVLKRDHHCLLVGRCVGLSNQRHFVVFVTWSTVALAYSLLHAVVYTASVFVPRNSFWDLLLPVAAIRAVARSVLLLDAAMVGVLYSLGWFLFTSIRFAVEQWHIVCRGVTSFEDEHQIKVRAARTISKKRKYNKCRDVSFVCEYGQTNKLLSYVAQIVRGCHHSETRIPEL